MSLGPLSTAHLRAASAALFCALACRRLAHAFDPDEEGPQWGAWLENHGEVMGKNGANGADNFAAPVGGLCAARSGLRDSRNDRA